MTQEWFFHGESTDLGPFTPSDMRNLSAMGRITANTLVKKGRDGKWVAADRVKGLISQEPSTSDGPTDCTSDTSATNQGDEAALVSAAPLTAALSRSEQESVFTSELQSFAQTINKQRGVAAAILISIAIFAGLMFFTKRNEGQRQETPLSFVQTTPRVSENEFRRQLFDAAYRAAVEYSPTEKVSLKNELDIIEPQIRGAGETEVFKLLRFISDLQTDMNCMEFSKIVTEKIRNTFDTMSPDAKDVARRLTPEIYNELSAVSEIHRAGGVIASSSIRDEVNQVMQHPLKRKLITHQTFNGVKWIPYDTTLSQLLAAEKAGLQVVGEMINNEGRPRSKP